MSRELSIKYEGYGRHTIFVNKLDKTKTYNDILKAIKQLEKDKRTYQITLDFYKVFKHSFPNCIVPLSGTLDYYMKNSDVKIKLSRYKNKYLKESSFYKPPIVTKYEVKKNRDRIFDKVWKFSNSTEIMLIVDSLIDEIRQKIICESGVISAMTWCISEVMDNALRHSKVNVGFFMCQLHESSKKLVFSIFDYGIGLYNSLYPKYKPKSFTYALELAMTKDVTSDDKDGQGFGLYGLRKFVNQNKGSLSITSRNAVYMYSNDHLNRDHYFDNAQYISNQNASVHIDFQLNYGNKINITEVLPGGPYDSFQKLIEELENTNGFIVFDVFKNTEGTGTRSSGFKTRNAIMNYMNENDKCIILDFKDVNHISSSFSDEFLGKLVEQIGEEIFLNKVRIRNIHPDIQTIVSHAINERIKSKSIDN